MFVGGRGLGRGIVEGNLKTTTICWQSRRETLRVEVSSNDMNLFFQDSVIQFVRACFALNLIIKYVNH